MRTSEWGLGFEDVVEWTSAEGVEEFEKESEVEELVEQYGRQPRQKRNPEREKEF